MSVRDDAVDEWERRYKQAALPEVLWNAVNYLKQHPEEESVQLSSPIDDFYLARGSEFTERMGIGWRQVFMDGDIYVMFRKYTEQYF